MEANEMEPGTRDEGGQALREFQRAHHEMVGAIAVRGFELEDDLAGWGTAQSFVAQGRTRNVAAQTFEGVSLLGATARIGSLIGNQIIQCDMPSGKQEKLECCVQTAKPRIPMARSFALIAVNALVSTA